MNNYLIIKNFLTPTECDDILNYSLKNLKLKKALVGESIANKKTRNSSVCFTQYDETFPFITKNLQKKLLEIINIRGYTINFENTEYQFTEYNEGQYYNWHIDGTSDISDTNARYCSIVISLNDEYEGGDLEMKFENTTDKSEKIIKFEKGKGNLFIFLSKIKHRVAEVTNGTRYSLVTWFSLKPINNYKKSLI